MPNSHLYVLYFTVIMCVNRFTFHGNAEKETILQQWNEWLSIAHSMESSIRKAAKYALGKDKAKVQVYLNSGTVSCCACNT